MLTGPLSQTKGTCKLHLGPVSWRPTTVKWRQFHSPTVIPPSAVDKPRIMKRYHRRLTTRWGVTARSPTIITLHDTRLVECRWWIDGWTVKTVVTWRSSASFMPAPGFGSRLLHWSFAKACHTSDLNIGTPEHTLLDAKRQRVSAGTGWPCVNIQWLGETEKLICNLFLVVAARPTAWAQPSLSYTSVSLGR